MYVGGGVRGLRASCLIDAETGMGYGNTGRDGHSELTALMARPGEK